MGFEHNLSAALWKSRMINSVSLIEYHYQSSIIDTYKLRKAIRLS